MAATVQSKAGDVVADMNTTPLIDVMLVLLTLLIITLPMQTHAIKIDTGHGETRRPADREPGHRLGRHHALEWPRCRPCDARSAISREPPSKTRNPTSIIQADRLTKYDRVAAVLEQAARAGETHIGFASLGQ